MSDHRNERRRQKRRSNRLHPFGEMLNVIFDAIEAAPTRQLSQMVKDIDALTQTNCWYATFRFGMHFRQVIKNEIERRKNFPETKPKRR